MTQHNFARTQDSQWCVEVKNVNTMRFLGTQSVLLNLGLRLGSRSSVGLAILAAFATLTWSNAASGQTPDSKVEPLDSTVSSAVTLDTTPVREGQPALSNPVLESPAEPLPLVPVGWSSEYLSQASPSDPQTPTDSNPPEVTVPADSPTPGVTPPASPEVIPPPGEGSTPRQETPDSLPLDAPPPSQPRIEIEQPPATPTPPAPNPGGVTPSPSTQEPEAKVLVAEVNVTLAGGNEYTTQQREQLIDQVYRAISTQPGRTTTRSQLQEDINAIFATGFFSNVRAIPADTPLGVRVTFEAQPNPVLSQVQVNANVGSEVPSVLPADVVQRIFSPQYGSILNFRQLQQGIQDLNKWYQDNGYVLAQVVEAPQVSPQGVVNLVVAEGVVENIAVRFLNKEGQTTTEEGQPVQGRTRDFIITRELDVKPGTVFNRKLIEQDLQRVFKLGIFEDVRLSLNPGTNPRQVEVVVNVRERNTGSIGAAAGISSASGLFGSVSYQQQNLGGNNQQLRAEATLGTRALVFELGFTDPWIAGDPNHTSYSVNFFRRQSISTIFTGGPDEVELSNGDRPRIWRTGGNVIFGRPLGPDKRNPEWNASLGLQYQRVSIRDADGDVARRDEEGNELSASDEGKDDLTTIQFGLVRDRRNDPLDPSRGTFTRFNVDQSIPIGLGGILFNRVRASHSFYIPVRFTNFNEGPQTLAFNVQGGGIIGDLPPYEAFPLGGINSVRGYGEGELGSARYFVQATAEYRFPLFSFLRGVLFVDFGSDLGSGSSVPGDPAGVRGKPGTGFGTGVGVRVRSPLGPIRIDYAINDEGSTRLQFGVGERF